MAMSCSLPTTSTMRNGGGRSCPTKRCESAGALAGCRRGQFDGGIVADGGDRLKAHVASPLDRFGVLLDKGAASHAVRLFRKAADAKQQEDGLRSTHAGRIEALEKAVPTHRGSAPASRAPDYRRIRITPARRMSGAAST